MAQPFIGPGAGNYGYQDVYIAPGSSQNWVNSVIERANSYVPPSNNTTNNNPPPNPNPEPSNPVYKTPEGWDYQGSQDQYMAEIQNAYNAGMGYWNTAEANLQKNLGLMKGQAESDYTANVGQLDTTSQSTLKGLATQKRAGQTRKEDAMAAARRLYSELQQANRQRFGGATSAGEAAGGIQGAETQRQMGQTWRQSNEFFQQIEGEKGNVENQYQSGLLQLQQAKQQALTSAQLDFNNAITQIAQGRAQTEQEKSQARLNALMDLRNKAFTIQQQDMQFKQQLDAMREQSLININAYNQTAGSSLASGANAQTDLYKNTTTNPSNYGVTGGTTNSLSNNPYVGQMSQSTGLSQQELQQKYPWLYNTQGVTFS